MQLTPLYSVNAIQDRVKQIAESLNKEYANEGLVHAVVVLNGAFMFAADLIRELDLPLVVHFVGAPDYESSESKAMRIQLDTLPKSFGNSPVLIIEDIVDGGNTIGKMRTELANRFAARIEVAALLKRQGGEGKADYHGFTVPKGLYLVGYGLDLDGRYRDIREICTFGTSTVKGGAGLC